MGEARQGPKRSALIAGWPLAVMITLAFVNGRDDASGERAT